MEGYTFEEVQKHNTKEDCWIIIKNNVYDITEFLSIHPGGSTIMITVSGKAATEYFEELHQPKILDEVGEEYKIGYLLTHNL